MGLRYAVKKGFPPLRRISFFQDADQRRRHSFPPLRFIHIHADLAQQAAVPCGPGHAHDPPVQQGRSSQHIRRQPGAADRMAEGPQLPSVRQLAFFQPAQLKGQTAFRNLFQEFPRREENSAADILYFPAVFGKAADPGGAGRKTDRAIPDASACRIPSRTSPEDFLRGQDPHPAHADDSPEKKILALIDPGLVPAFLFHPLPEQLPVGSVRQISLLRETAARGRITVLFSVVTVFPLSAPIPQSASSCFSTIFSILSEFSFCPTLPPASYYSTKYEFFVALLDRCGPRD